jgi:ABC-2 type transport system permease protein
MTALISAELLKLRTVRSTWVVLLLLPLVAVLSLLDAALDPVEHNAGVVDFMDVALVVVGITLAAFAAAQVGNEFQRKMIGLDYLAVPTRIHVLAAKFTAFAVVGLVLGLLSTTIAHAVVAPIATGRDVPLDGIVEIVARIAAVTAATAIVAALGAAIGLLVPQPAVAAGAIIAWQIAEGVLGQAIGIGEYLPIGLITTVAHLGGTVPLPAAFGLLCLYSLLVGGAGLTIARRRDLT